MKGLGASSGLLNCLSWPDSKGFLSFWMCFFPLFFFYFQGGVFFREMSRKTKHFQPVPRLDVTKVRLARATVESGRVAGRVGQRARH